MTDLRHLRRLARLHVYQTRQDGFREFFCYYFGSYITRDFAPIHDEFFEIGRRLLWERGEAHNVIAFKESAKSAILGEALIVAAVCLGAHDYIAIQGNRRAVKDRANKIIRLLTTNERILEDFGDTVLPMKDIKNQLEEFNDNAVILRNDRKIVFLGPGGSIKGSRHDTGRPSLYIIDDLHKGTDYDSPETLARHVVMADENIASLDMERSNALCLANVRQVDSIQGRLMDRPGWQTMIRPIYDKAGEPIWFTREQCEAKRGQVGEYTWVRDYLCEDYDGTQQVWSWDRLDHFDPAIVTWDASRGVRMVGADLVDRCVVWSDPAAGFDKSKPRKAQTGDPDRFVVVAAAQGRSGQRYVLAADVVEDSPRETRALTDRGMDALVRMAAAFCRASGDEVGWESNGFQELLGVPIRRRLREAGVTCQIRGLPSHGTRKETRIISLEPSLLGAERSVSFSADLPQAYREEWARFRVTGTKGHDDCMDATEQALRRLSRPVSRVSFGPDSMVA